MPRSVPTTCFDGRNYTVTGSRGKRLGTESDVPLEIHAVVQQSNDFKSVVGNQAEDDEMSRRFDDSQGRFGCFRAVLKMIYTKTLGNVRMGPASSWIGVSFQ